MQKAVVKDEGEMNYIPSKYSKCLNMYSKNYMKWVSPYLNCISKTCNYGSKYPIFKVLKAISKIFLLNQIQIIFLAYMIKQTSWDIKDKLITYNSQSIRDVVCCSNDQPQYKSLILYLMVTSYSVKFYLNQTTIEVLEQANKICPNFKMIFQNWAKKHANLTKRINPKTLNKVYQNLVLETRKQQPDFNMIVDAIIQISPAYNPQKGENKKKQYAQIKRQPIKKQKCENPIIITSSLSNHNLSNHKPSDHNSSNHNPSNHNNNNIGHNAHQSDAPAFSSSALYDIMSHGKNFPQQQNSIYYKGRNPINKSNFLGSSFVGLRYDITDRPDDNQICQSLILNLKEGQSEEQIIIQDCQQEPTPGLHSSVINLTRNHSITEKYWANNINDDKKYAGYTKRQE